MYAFELHLYDIGQCFKSETLNTLLGFFFLLLDICTCNACNEKYWEFELKYQNYLLRLFRFCYLFISLPSISQNSNIWYNKKNHYLSQFKDAQSKMQQYRKMETESWYTMTLLNISDIFCPWNICRSFPLYNRYMYVICHFHLSHWYKIYG